MAGAERGIVWTDSPETRTKEELYTLPYDSMSREELNSVSLMAAQRGEDWKLREIADHADGEAEQYQTLARSSRRDADMINRNRVRELE